MSLGGQAIGIVETSAAHASPGSRIEIYGDGWIRAENTLTGAASVSTSAGAHATFAEPGPLAPYAAEVDDFLAAVRGGTSVGADGDEARLVVEVLEASLAGGVRLRRAGC